MAISRKPKAGKKGVNVDALINKGGSAAKEGIGKDGTAAILLRMPQDMLLRIDNLVKARVIKTPRHTWILEAVLEKLAREEGQ